MKAARDRLGLPFKPLQPNAETVATMANIRSGKCKGTRFRSAEELLDHLKNSAGVLKLNPVNNQRCASCPFGGA